MQFGFVVVNGMKYSRESAINRGFPQTCDGNLEAYAWCYQHERERDIKTYVSDLESANNPSFSIFVRSVDCGMPKSSAAFP